MAVYFHRLFDLDFWGVFGLVAQGVFMARFIVQWIASERRGESTIPVSFWYLSIVGSLGTLAYGFGKMELPIILGQLPGTVVYARNLVLIHRKRRAGGGSESHLTLPSRADTFEAAGQTPADLTPDPPPNLPARPARTTRSAPVNPPVATPAGN